MTKLLLGKFTYSDPQIDGRHKVIVHEVDLELDLLNLDQAYEVGESIISNSTYESYLIPEDDRCKIEYEVGVGKFSGRYKTVLEDAYEYIREFVFLRDKVSLNQQIDDGYGVEWETEIEYMPILSTIDRRDKVTYWAVVELYKKDNDVYIKCEDTEMEGNSTELVLSSIKKDDEEIVLFAMDYHFEFDLIKLADYLENFKNN